MTSKSSFNLKLHLTISCKWALVLIDQQSVVGKRNIHLIDTVNAKNRWTTIYWRVNNF
jgi:hypothetical protein